MTEEEKKITARRIKEAIGDDTQTVAADKIHMGQPAVCRLINGSDYPTSTTVIEICKAYNVSADWLLGLSDNVSCNLIDDDHVTYAQAVSVLSGLLKRDSITSKGKEKNEPLSSREYEIHDPLLKYLLDCRYNAAKTGKSILKTWKNKNLSKFDIEVIRTSDWQSQDEDDKMKYTDDESWLWAYNYSLFELEELMQLVDAKPYWKEKSRNDHSKK